MTIGGRPLFALSAFKRDAGDAFPLPWRLAMAKEGVHRETVLTVIQVTNPHALLRIDFIARDERVLSERDRLKQSPETRFFHFKYNYLTGV